MLNFNGRYSATYLAFRFLVFHSRSENTRKKKERQVTDLHGLTMLQLC